jgi:alanine racemase
MSGPEELFFESCPYYKYSLLLKEEKAAMRATKAVIHLDNFRRNIEAARRKAGPHPRLCVPVKADAYGHGAVQVSNCALEAGAGYLAVATVAEGAELRAAGIGSPVLLLSQALPGEIPEIISLELSPLVSDGDFIDGLGRAAAQAGKTISLHLKVDTGMGRMGCAPDEAVGLAAKIASMKGLELGGTATHLSVSDSPEPVDMAYTREQISRFRDTVDSIRKAGIEPGIVHAANSGALVFHEDSYFDMIRPGIFLYGYSPAASVRGGLLSEPVMELRSAVVLVKQVRKGDAVSYGRTWIAPRDTSIGVIPVGYADGLPRILSNNFSIYIGGGAYPLVGRICMDQCMVDLGNESAVRRWDEAVIFGPGHVTAADLAKKIGTIPYEITCNINKRVPRVFYE